MEFQNEQEELAFYKSAYECEKEKRIELEQKVENLQAKLDRIYENKYFKATKPLRVFAYFLLRNIKRVKNLGNVKGVLKKLNQKRNDKKASGPEGGRVIGKEGEIVIVIITVIKPV